MSRASVNLRDLREALNALPRELDLEIVWVERDAGRTALSSVAVENAEIIIRCEESWSYDDQDQSASR